ncbi:MAG: hypothetical protein Pg6A_20090 [Termitinemataceae bacterium]|nr:MAG: hypothetical protein Pg6A_20090 [Termitinemataceae bacterium]
MAKPDYTKDPRGYAVEPVGLNLWAIVGPGPKYEHFLGEVDPSKPDSGVTKEWHEEDKANSALSKWVSVYTNSQGSYESGLYSDMRRYLDAEKEYRSQGLIAEADRVKAEADAIQAKLDSAYAEKVVNKVEGNDVLPNRLVIAAERCAKFLTKDASVVTEDEVNVVVKHIEDVTTMSKDVQEAFKALVRQKLGEIRNGLSR